MNVPLEHALKLLRFVREEPKNSNRGQAVEAFLARVGLKPGDPWCAAAVSYIGDTLYGERWPLPMTGGCATLGDAAKRLKVLHQTPEAGDVFLVYFPKLRRLAHTGFVLEVQSEKNGATTCRTWEGNTNDGGSRDGYGMFERTRTFGPNDRFIRWRDALE